MVALQEVTVPGCRECIEFEELWETIKGDFPNVELKQYDATSPEGQAMVQKYEIMAAPGIVINGELFSTGGVDKKKLMEKLQALGGYRTPY